MGVAVLILGDSGSGKSTSLRNFDKDEVAVMSILGKRLPFRKKLDVLNHAGYGAVQQALSLKAPISAGLRLGEGSGAVALLPLLDLALAVYHSGQTFDKLGIAAYQPQDGRPC